MGLQYLYLLRRGGNGGRGGNAEVSACGFNFRCFNQEFSLLQLLARLRVGLQYLYLLRRGGNGGRGGNAEVSACGFNFRRAPDMCGGRGGSGGEGVATVEGAATQKSLPDRDEEAELAAAAAGGGGGPAMPADDVMMLMRFLTKKKLMMMMMMMMMTVMVMVVVVMTMMVMTMVRDVGGAVDAGGGDGNVRREARGVDRSRPDSKSAWDVFPRLRLVYALVMKKTGTRMKCSNPKTQLSCALKAQEIAACDLRDELCKTQEICPEPVDG
ncbi:unnamed protein product [Symbiodinium microadriaticum]|nr:unnamed protein product [Symbiodinium microadriaticum]